MKPLLVGEANPYGADPEFALYPAPDGSAGHRLATKILGLSRKDYLERFDRVNLCPQRWAMKEARANARAILAQTESRPVVLFGAKVASAFGLNYDPFTTRTVASPARPYACFPLIILPHPSGLSRGWDPNHEAAFERARALLRAEGAL